MSLSKPPGEGSSTGEVALLVGLSQSKVLRLVYRFPDRLRVRKAGGGVYSWTPEDVASLRTLLAEPREPKVRLSTSQAATLAGISYPRLLNLIRRKRRQIPLVKRRGALDWSPVAVAILRDLVAHWRAGAKDDGPLPQGTEIRSLPVRDLVLAARLPVLLSFSRKLGVTARLGGLDVQVQGTHPRDAVARLRRHLVLRYQELKDDPLQTPEVWAGLQKIITPRQRRQRRRGPSEGG